MSDSPNIEDQCSGAWRQNIDNIEERGLLSCEPDELGNIDDGTNLIIDNDYVDEVELDDIYVGRIFGDENEPHDAYNSYALTKGFGIRNDRILKSRTDPKVIHRQYLCSKEGKNVETKVTRVKM